MFYANNLTFLRSSLCVRPWCDVLLVSVLKGQNVSGVRNQKGKKEVLFEPFPVVLLRTELLQRQRRFAYVHSFFLPNVDRRTRQQRSQRVCVYVLQVQRAVSLPTRRSD